MWKLCATYEGDAALQLGNCNISSDKPGSRVRRCPRTGALNNSQARPGRAVPGQAGPAGSGGISWPRPGREIQARTFKWLLLAAVNLNFRAEHRH